MASVRPLSISSVMLRTLLLVSVAVACIFTDAAWGIATAASAIFALIGVSISEAAHG